ncbi:MAG: hypothetical protein H7A25_17835 [Leptospiraceae bacterium]|nr:hypothetical protein [Leptospiraceae bacterium]MCP5501769.1 hypothetical protein [Leptospiraceae bacterium]
MFENDDFDDYEILVDAERVKAGSLKDKYFYEKIGIEMWEEMKVQIKKAIEYNEDLVFIVPRGYLKSMEVASVFKTHYFFEMKGVNELIVGLKSMDGNVYFFLTDVYMMDVFENFIYETFPNKEDEKFLKNRVL